MLYKYFIKTPWWVRSFFSSYVWRIPTHQKTVYLTFDDGPHPTITPWVLKELKKYEAKATFFCIGNNVVLYPDIFQQLLEGEHSVGNHTQHHLNGWKTATAAYLKDVAEASRFIHTTLFRPPYGRITAAQAKGLFTAMNSPKTKIIMWDVLSADFDTNLTPEQCTANVLRNISPGSIIVFHDSEKAFKNLKTTLPSVLSALAKEGYKFEKIVMGSA